MHHSSHSFCHLEGEYLILNVLGNPNAKKTCFGKVKGDQIKISVNANPVNGEATERMIQFLAIEFGVRIKDIEVVFGQTQINKRLKIHAPKKLPYVVSAELHRRSSGLKELK